MTDPYDRDERLAIRIADGMPESRAIDLTDAEMRKAKSNAPKEPESVMRARQLRMKMKFDALDRRGGSGSRKVLASGKDE